MDTLFGEGQSGLKVVLFVIVVLGLLALAFWLLIKGFNPQAYGQARDNLVRPAAAPATA